MRTTLLSIILLTSSLLLNGQGAGFGYEMAFGYKGNFDVGEGYSQSMQSTQHNFFVRWHSNEGKRGHQIVTGLRLDSIGFTNEVAYKNAYTLEMVKPTTDAYLKRIAWRFGYVNHYQFIGKPGGFVIAANYGLFYEFTSQMKRTSIYDNLEYKLYSEQNRHNLVGGLGVEMRFWYFTMGYRYEHMFFDMLNHDYIKTKPLTPENSSELRGMKLRPSMSYFYMVFNFDFFNSNSASSFEFD